MEEDGEREGDGGVGGCGVAAMGVEGVVVVGGDEGEHEGEHDEEEAEHLFAHEDAGGGGGLGFGVLIWFRF